VKEQLYNLAFVFPGQGSQSVGMLNALAASYSEVKQTFESASDALGQDLWKLVAEGSEEELNQTQNTQPVMLVAGVAVWKIWCSHSKIRPFWMAGHSLGEYTALVCSGSLSLVDAVKLVAIRGQLMQQAVPDGEGAMAAIIGLDNPMVVKICADAAENEVVSAVNFNAPGQVVIAGNKSAVIRAMALAKQESARMVVLLPVSVPSHCQLMLPAAEKLEEYLQKTDFSKPDVTLIHNTDVASHPSAEAIRLSLKKQLYSPVLWVDTIKYMHDQGVTRFVECGPGKVLAGMNKRIVKDAEHFSIYDPKSLDILLEQQ
jgi:[acyl-carrier-protein] S-malonyltransferase